MKGLLLKDLYQLRRYTKIYLLYVLLFGGLTIFTGEPGLFGAMAGVLMFTLPLSAFNSDEHYGWHKLALSMPLSRNQVVLSKYCVTGLCMAGTLIIQLAVTLLCSLWGGMDLVNLLVAGVASCLVIALMMLILLPFILKMGVEKGRILMMLLFGGTFAAVMLISGLLKNNKVLASIANISGGMLMGIAVLVMVVVAFVSYKVSCAIFAKKEF